MSLVQRLTPCLWFDDQAESAAKFYVGIFRNSKITQVSYYGEAGHEIHGRAAGSVLTVAFEIDGHTFTALNGGPQFKFTEAVSFQVMCDTQEEVDYYWAQLGAGGDPNAQQCGWLKDKFGLSWQVAPRILASLVSDPDSTKSERVMAVLMGMKKLDIAGLQKAFDGG